MSVGRVYWVWALLFLGVLGVATGMGARWYGFEAETPESGPFVAQFGDDIPPPDFQLHTHFWQDGHQQLEGLSGEGGNEDSFPHIAQVMGVVRVFYVIGAVGVACAIVGLLFRMRGLPDGKGLVGSVAAFSLMALLFSAVYFGATIPEAYNDYLETQRGESPEIAFYTLGIDSEDGAWENATSAPSLGWYAGIGGGLALAAAFALAFAGDLRRARAAIVDDEVAEARHAERFGGAEPHVVDRFREEGRP